MRSYVRYVSLLFFSLVMMCTFSRAQNNASVIHGRLTSDDGTPVAWVHVELKSLHKSVLSNDDGKFIFQNLSFLEDSLVISSGQYVRYACAVTVCGGNKLDLGNIILQDHIAVLQDIEIKGSRSSSYKNNYSFLGTKTQGSIKDIPQTISVISAQLIQDRMDHSLNDVIENISGVNLFSDYQEYTIRGFRAENPELVNGLRTYNATLVKPMLANIERVEVIKGPSSVLYGNGDPGGLINMVTKKPLAEKNYRVSVGTGSWSDKRLAADFTGPLNEKRSVLYRFNAAYRNTKSFRDELFDKSFQLAPSFSWSPDSRLNLNFDLSLSHSNTVADRGQPGLQNNSDVNATPINLIASQPGDYLRETSVASIASFSYKFNQHISINSSYLNYITRQKLSEHGIRDYITDDSASLYYTKRTTHAMTHNFTNYAVFNFNTGPLNHQLLAGYDFIANNADIEQWNGELPDQFGSSTGIAGTFSLIHPQHFRRPIATYSQSTTTEAADNDDAAKYFTNGIYVQDELSLKKWRILFSVRKEFYSTGDDEDQSAGNLGSLGDLEQNVFLPRIGVTYKLNNDANLYITWNKGFEPFEASSNLPAFGGPFKPIYSELLEAGMKSELFKKKLYAGVSIYRIKQTNVLVNANDPANPDRSMQAGSDASKGFELETSGNIFSNLSIAASYAYNVTKIISGNNPEEVGKIEANAPKNISGSWIKYHFDEGILKHFILAAGHSQVSCRNTYSDLILPAYCIFNAGIGYAHKDITINCNFNNIGNRHYYVGGYNNINKWPGRPFNAIAEVAWQFK